jgi:3'(2'), 5'-bisphosphate nucleotidase
LKTELISPLQNTAMAAALKAGQAIMDVYRTCIRVKNKADGSPITEADQQANNIILEFLASTPYPVISEETEPAGFHTRKAWESVWLVDPLDGTKEFIKGTGEFSVNIALVENGRPVMGVILAPATDTLWTGTRDGGVYKLESASTLLNGGRVLAGEFPRYATQIAPGSNGDGKTAQGVIIGVSRSHKEPKTEALIRKISERYGEVRIGQMGSSLKFCEMAEGKMSIYPRCTPIFEWDTAAGHAILHAAGGEVYNLDDYKPLEYNKQDLRSRPFIAFSTRLESDRFFSEFPLQVRIR